MRHFLYDWNHWTIPERVIAVTLLVGALMVPAALAVAS